MLSVRPLLSILLVGAFSAPPMAVRTLPSPAQDPLSARASGAPDAPRPVAPVPSAQQLAWHELEYYAFVHFNMSTFTDEELGDGKEHPNTFHPTELDCRQWARVAREAGMRGIILTAKHHDGFCLWPTATTDHSVASTSWRAGKGDVLRELADACREFGLFLGLSLSPRDQNHSSHDDRPSYNRVFRQQLAEILTGYGEVTEVRFDGARGAGPDGEHQDYDWPGFVAIVREHQPNAVISSDAGPDVRWVGNERGRGGETDWCLIRRDELARVTQRYPDLTDGHEDGTHWLPAELETSIRPSWFYHSSEDDQVKSLDDLLATWHASIGRGGNLLLNLPVDRRGLVPENDAAALKRLRRAVGAIYATDLARDATATASNTRGGEAGFAPGNVLDGDAASYWATDDGVVDAWLELAFDGPRTFDRLLLREHIALGQRVRAFEVRIGEEPEGWRAIARGTTIGARRILVFPEVSTARLRIHIEDARGCPTIGAAELYLAPSDLAAVARSRPIPPAPTHFMGREIAQTMSVKGGSWLLRSDRATNENTALLMKELDVTLGQTVCDLGAGNGYHTLRFAERVGPAGKVFAVEIQDAFLDQLRSRADEAGLKNIDTILGNAVDPHLPASSCDLIFMADVYHELSHPEEMLSAVRKALKPSGRLALVEFRVDEAIKRLHKMTKRQVTKEIEANGFVLERTFDGLPRQHLLLFGREDASAE